MDGNRDQLRSNVARGLVAMFALVCADGHPISVHLSVPDKFWSSLLDALEARDTLGADPRFKSRKDRVGTT